MVFGKKHHEIIELNNYEDLIRIGDIGLDGKYNSDRSFNSRKKDVYSINFRN